MNYYIFKPAIANKDTGKIYPQIQKMCSGYDFDAKNSVDSLARATKSFPINEPNLDYFVIHNNAKLTDLLSTGIISGGFLISNELKDVFEKFNLISYKLYKARVYHKKVFYDYFWIHFISNLTKFVDYDKSTFFIYETFIHDLGDIKISSESDLIEKRMKIKNDNPDKTITIWSKDLYLTDQFDKKIDLFEIGSFDSNFYISEQLLNELNDKNITGFSAMPAINIHI